MPNKQRPSTRKAFFFGFDGFRRLSFDQPVRNRRLFVSQRGPCSSVNSQTDKNPPSGLVDNSLLRKTPSSKAKIAKRNAVSRPVPHAKHAHVRVENDQAGSITFICRRVSSKIVFFMVLPQFRLFAIDHVTVSLFATQPFVHSTVSRRQH